MKAPRARSRIASPTLGATADGAWCSTRGPRGGYRAALYRFPELHTSFALLCNLAPVNTTAMEKFKGLKDWQILQKTFDKMS